MNTANQTLRALILLLACFAVACDDSPAENDGGRTGMDAATPPDAAAGDGGMAIPQDGGPTDSGAPDGGSADSGGIIVPIPIWPDGGPTDSGAPDDGAPDGGSADSGTDPVDAGPPDDDPVGDEVACADTTCTGRDVCCVVLNPLGSAACMSPQECEAVALTCDGPEDCRGGSACCVVATGSPPLFTITAVCADPTEPSCQSELCHTADDCSDPTMACCPSPIGLGQVCAPTCL